jgi:MerR family mercuric resistance operon transcriptional regulator
VPGTYSISQLAASADVPVSTIRFYERSGLLAPDGRTESNYRVYGQRSLDRLRFIRAAQASGLALEDIATLLRLRDGNVAPRLEVQPLLERRLAETERRLADLRRVRSMLRSSVAECEQAASSGRCRVIERLDRAADGDSPSPRSRRRKKT